MDTSKPKDTEPLSTPSEPKPKAKSPAEEVAEEVVDKREGGNQARNHELARKETQTILKAFSQLQKDIHKLEETLTVKPASLALIEAVRPIVTQHLGEVFEHGHERKASIKFVKDCSQAITAQAESLNSLELESWSHFFSKVWRAIKQICTLKKPTFFTATEEKEQLENLNKIKDEFNLKIQKVQDVQSIELEEDNKPQRP